MFCQECGKNQAKVSIETPNGTVRYCEGCAAGKLGDSGQSSCCSAASAPLPGKIPQHIVAIIPMIQGVIQSSLGALGAAPSGGGGALPCKACGSTFQELVAHGRFSCPSCYEAFSSELRRQTSALFGGSFRYLGKYPRRSFRHLELGKVVQGLRTQLDEEVRNENYEKAVKLRDTIQNLEREIAESSETC